MDARLDDSFDKEWTEPVIGLYPAGRSDGDGDFAVPGVLFSQHPAGNDSTHTGLLNPALRLVQGSQLG